MKLFVEDENLSNFGHLRALLQKPPTDARWREVLNVLHALRLRDQERYEHEQLPYAIDVLQRCWPRELRRLSCEESMLLVKREAWHHLVPLITQGLSTEGLGQAFHVLDRLGEEAMLDRCELSYLGPADVEKLPTHIDRFMDVVPLRHITGVYDVTAYGPLLERLGQVDQPHLEGLQLCREIPMEQAQAIFRPGWSGERLRVVGLVVAHQGEALMHHLSRLELGALRELALTLGSGASSTQAPLQILAGARWLAQCERMKLVAHGEARPDEEGWRALGVALAGGELRELVLDIKSFEYDDFAILFEQLEGSKLERLSLQDARLEGEELTRLLVERALPASLKWVHFKALEVADEVVMRLAGRPALANVALSFSNKRLNKLARLARQHERHTTMVMNKSYHDDAALAQLRHMPVWHTLQQLDLRKSRVSDAGVEAMMAGEPPRAMRCIDLSGLNLSLGTWHALLEHSDYGKRVGLELRLSMAVSEVQMQEVFDAWVAANDPEQPLIIPNTVHKRSVLWLLQQDITSKIVTLRLSGGLNEEVVRAVLDRFERGGFPALRRLESNFGDGVTLATSSALCSGAFAAQVTLDVSARYHATLAWVLGQGHHLDLSLAEVERGALSLAMQLIAERELPPLRQVAITAPWPAADNAPLSVEAMEALDGLLSRETYGIRLHNVTVPDEEAFFTWALSRERFPALNTLVYGGRALEDAFATRLLDRLEQEREEERPSHVSLPLQSAELDARLMALRYSRRR